MGPSETLKSKAAAAINETDIQNYLQWAGLWKSIPIFEAGWTAIEQLMEKTGFEEEDNGLPFVIWLNAFLNNPNKIIQITCAFYEENQARIQKNTPINTPRILADKNFFGFEGTWEQVTGKMIEANNLLLSPAPPFPYVKKEE